MTPLIIGRTTHSIEQLNAACQQLPTYVSLGPVFATPTKPALESVGPDYVRQAIEILKPTGIGSVAVGGITLKNVEEVLGAGAKAIAVCSAVTQVPDPTAVCRELRKKIADFTA